MERSGLAVMMNLVDVLGEPCLPVPHTDQLDYFRGSVLITIRAHQQVDQIVGRWGGADVQLLAKHGEELVHIFMGMAGW